MRSFIFGACLAVAAFLIGLSCATPRVITKTVEIEVPGPIREPDTTELDSLRVRLAAAEAEAAANRKGWQDAYAAWQRANQERVTRPAARPAGAAYPASATGGEGTPVRLFRWRGSR
jgi:hypothetical protein